MRSRREIGSVPQRGSVGFVLPVVTRRYRVAVLTRSLCGCTEKK